MRQAVRTRVATCCSGTTERYHRRVWIDLNGDRPRALLAPLSLVVVLGACHGSSSSAKTVGELGNGEFIYECVNPNDGACESVAEDVAGEAVFPECILLGGQFEMSYELHEFDAVDDDFDLFIYVESASQSFFAGNGRYRADRVGRAAMLAREGDQVIDIIHLDIVEAEGIVVKDILGRTVEGPVEVIEGRSVALDVFPLRLGCVPLGGGGTVTATSREPDVATAEGGERIVIRGEQLGFTRVTVGMAGFEQDIDVLVTEGPARRKKPWEYDDDGGESSSDGGTDDGGSSTDAGDTDGGSDSSGSEG